MAIQNANTLASERVDVIFSLLNPPQASNVLAHELLVALSIGLALLPGPPGVVAGTLVKAAQQVSTAAMLLFLVGNTDTRVAQWANINNKLATVVQTCQTQRFTDHSNHQQ